MFFLLKNKWYVRQESTFSGQYCTYVALVGKSSVVPDGIKFDPAPFVEICDWSSFLWSLNTSTTIHVHLPSSFGEFWDPLSKHTLNQNPNSSCRWTTKIPALNPARSRIPKQSLEGSSEALVLFLGFNFFDTQFKQQGARKSEPEGPNKPTTLKIYRSIERSSKPVTTSDEAQCSHQVDEHVRLLI